jgi:hypothetical protein
MIAQNKLASQLKVAMEVCRQGSIIRQNTPYWIGSAKAHYNIGMILKEPTLLAARLAARRNTLWVFATIVSFCVGMLIGLQIR